MFERFTEKAVRVVTCAQDEARRLGHNFVDVEMLLIGILAEGSGVAYIILKSMGVNIKEVREEVEKLSGRGCGIVSSKIPFTPRVKKVLELSWDKARQLGHNYIGTEHLLLALIGESNGGIANILKNLGVDLDKCHSNLIKMIDMAKNQKVQYINVDDTVKEMNLGYNKELENIIKEKEEAIRNQDFDKATELMEKEKLLKSSLIVEQKPDKKNDNADINGKEQILNQWMKKIKNYIDNL